MMDIIINVKKVPFNSSNMISNVDKKIIGFKYTLSIGETNTSFVVDSDANNVEINKRLKSSATALINSKINFVV